LLRRFCFRQIIEDQELLAAMTRFSFSSLLANALTDNTNWQPQWPDAEPKAEYDVIIVGAGGHGLGAAYYLAQELAYSIGISPEEREGVENVGIS
jgi:ribulose 1,5-bisphosphate synthetase/thiazole synthase